MESSLPSKKSEVFLDASFLLSMIDENGVNNAESEEIIDYFESAGWDIYISFTIGFLVHPG